MSMLINPGGGSQVKPLLDQQTEAATAAQALIKPRQIMRDGGNAIPGQSNAAMKQAIAAQVGNTLGEPGKIRAEDRAHRRVMEMGDVNHDRNIELGDIDHQRKSQREDDVAKRNWEIYGGKDEHEQRKEESKQRIATSKGQLDMYIANKQQAKEKMKVTVLQAIQGYRDAATATDVASSRSKIAESILKGIEESIKTSVPAHHAKVFNAYFNNPDDHEHIEHIMDNEGILNGIAELTLTEKQAIGKLLSSTLPGNNVMAAHAVESHREELSTFLEMKSEALKLQGITPDQAKIKTAQMNQIVDVLSGMIGMEMAPMESSAIGGGEIADTATAETATAETATDKTPPPVADYEGTDKDRMDWEAGRFKLTGNDGTHSIAAKHGKTWEGFLKTPEGKLWLKQKNAGDRIKPESMVYAAAQALEDMGKGAVALHLKAWEGDGLATVITEMAAAGMTVAAIVGLAEKNGIPPEKIKSLLATTGLDKSGKVTAGGKVGMDTKRTTSAGEARVNALRERFNRLPGVTPYDAKPPTSAHGGNIAHGAKASADIKAQIKWENDAIRHYERELGKVQQTKFGQLKRLVTKAGGKIPAAVLSRWERKSVKADPGNVVRGDTGKPKYGVGGAVKTTGRIAIPAVTGYFVLNEIRGILSDISAGNELDSIADEVDQLYRDLEQATQDGQAAILEARKALDTNATSPDTNATSPGASIIAPNLDTNSTPDNNSTGSINGEGGQDLVDFFNDDGNATPNGVADEKAQLASENQARQSAVHLVLMDNGVDSYFDPAEFVLRPSNKGTDVIPFAYMDKNPSPIAGVEIGEGDWLYYRGEFTKSLKHGELLTLMTRTIVTNDEDGTVEVPDSKETIFSERHD